jgi:hypothetical protein
MERNQVQITVELEFNSQVLAVTGEELSIDIAQTLLRKYGTILVDVTTDVKEEPA